MLILGNNTRANFHLVTNLEDTSKDTATGYTTLELLNIGTRLVDLTRVSQHAVYSNNYFSYIERSDNHHARTFGEVSHRHRDVRD